MMARSERVWGAPQQAFFLCVYTQELLAGFVQAEKLLFFSCPQLIKKHLTF